MSKDKYVGKTFVNNQGFEFVVLGDIGKDRGFIRYEVQFLKSGLKRITTSSHINDGRIKDFLYPTIFNVACIGMPSGNIKIPRKYYDTWYNMIARCYNKFHMEFCRYGEIGVKVDNRWLNFANFLEDIRFLKGFSEELFLQKNQIHLDKDFLQQEIPHENRVYSKDTCCFLSIKENCSLTNSSKRRNKFKAISPNKKQYFSDNMRLFAEEHQLSYKAISGCLNKKQKQHKGWIFIRC